MNSNVRKLPFQNRVRSIGAQIARMSKCWSNFEVIQCDNNTVRWHGPIRGFQQKYIIGIFWCLDGIFDKPYVSLIYPHLMPREGGLYNEIPHLIFYKNDPVHSGLCLFNPECKEWSNRMLIADTTMPWTAEWLLYYELWHYDGIWRGDYIGVDSN